MRPEGSEEDSHADVWVGEHFSQREQHAQTSMCSVGLRNVKEASVVATEEARGRAMRRTQKRAKVGQD